MPNLEATVQLVFNIELEETFNPQDATLWFQFDMRPADVDFDSEKLESTATLQIDAIPVDLKNPILAAIEEQIDGQIENFFDVRREGKTLMNFGRDYQALMTNWDFSQGRTDRLRAKLYRPLPDDVEEGSRVYVSKELSYPLIDQLFVIVQDALGRRIYLRPPNRRIQVSGVSGRETNKITSAELLSENAFDPVRPRDRLTEEWFTTALEGAELNVDYTNFSNFVFFSSAEQRIRSFRNKLILMKQLDETIERHESSLPDVAEDASFPAVQALGRQRQSIIRSFDPYERFLYYESGIGFEGPFRMAPFDDEWDEEYSIEELTYPKDANGDPVDPESAPALDWMAEVIPVARRYDSWNVNRLSNNVPAYLRDDENSQEFIKFLDMTGHMYDTIKLYIDRMSEIFDRNNDPLEGLSQDLVWDIAKSFGIDLPNQYSVKRALEYTVGEDSNAKVYRQAASETWKRFLHNQIFLMKTKGTKASLKSLMNVYGVSPYTIRIRESSTPTLLFGEPAFEERSFESFEEQTLGLYFEGQQRVVIPWHEDVSTLQVRFRNSNITEEQTLIDADGEWLVKLNPDTDNSFTISLERSGNAEIETDPIIVDPEDFISLMIRNPGDNVEMLVEIVDMGGNVTLLETLGETSGNIESAWEDPTEIQIGGEGTTPSNGFYGEVDEFRLWDELIDDETFDQWARYPALYHGVNEKSAANSLRVRLSFNRAQNVGDSGYVWNEFPRDSTEQFDAFGFEDEPDYPFNFSVITRVSQRLSPNAGGTQYDDNKIKIVAPPEPKMFAGTNIPFLSRTDSMVSIEDKEEFSKSNNVIGFYFSTTDIVNDGILKSMGDFNLHDLIGDPRDQFKAKYPDLRRFNDLYWMSYAYDVDKNRFVDFVRDILGPMFQQARDLVPVRSKLLTGQVFEPNVLERNKVKNRPVVKEDLDLFTDLPPVSRDIDSDVNDLEVSIDNEEQYDLSFGLNDLVTDLSFEEDYNLDVGTDDLLAVIDKTREENILVTLDELSAKIDSTIFSDVDGKYLDLFVSISLEDDVYVYANKVIQDAQEQGIIFRDMPIIPTYGPRADLDGERDLPSTQFFQDPDGLVAVTGYERVRYSDPGYNELGDWVQGTVYRQNDLVVDPIDGREYYAIRDGVSSGGTSPGFISNVPPSREPAFWRRVAYVNRETKEIKKAVLINGEFTLVDPNGPSGGEPPVIGYLPQHYKNFRQTNTGYVRARYTGVVQTPDTTTDGDDPVVIRTSAGDRLTVNDPEAPIQREQNQSGPILDVE